jgi:hypothetical protein
MPDDDYPDLLGRQWLFPRTAWEDDEPARPIEERLALVALAARAAAVPADALLDASAFLDAAVAGLPHSRVVHELRRGLAEAAQLIAEAPWNSGPGLVSAAPDETGLPRVVPIKGWSAPEPNRVARHLLMAAAVGLTDTPLDLRWLPLELAASNLPAADAPRIEPAEFMFMGHAEAPGPIRLWLYKHSATRAYLNLDADSWPWRYTAVSGTYAAYDEAVTALVDVHALPGSTADLAR